MERLGLGNIYVCACLHLHAPLRRAGGGAPVLVPCRSASVFSVCYTGPAVGVGQHVRRPRAQVRWGSKLKYVYVQL
jgi:hypothetical protein